MEENEYRNTYNAVNQLRCGFEKAILTRQCACKRSTRFCLADREGVSCNASVAQTRCHALLGHLRKSAVFALKLTHLDGPLPHAKEIRVQAGGMRGLQKTMHPGVISTAKVEDIDGLINDVLSRYHSLDELPYQEIVQSIVAFAGRPKRQHRS